MFIERHIQRHQLPCVLKVYNRFTDQQIGYLGNASEDGLMLISQLPVLVGPDFELQLRVPQAGGGQQNEREGEEPDGEIPEAGLAGGERREHSAA